MTTRTNDGLMRRTGISKRVEAEHVVVDFDEEDEAGSRVNVASRFSEEFTTGDTGVTCGLVISKVEARGLLRLLYRRFGSSKMGNAFLTAHQGYFEEHD